MAGELSCPSCKKIFVAGVSGSGSCSGCGAQVSISRNPGNTRRHESIDDVRWTPGDDLQSNKAKTDRTAYSRGYRAGKDDVLANRPSKFDKLPAGEWKDGYRDGVLEYKRGAREAGARVRWHDDTSGWMDRNPGKRRNPPSDDRIVVQQESGGYGVHYLIRGDSKPDDLNRVAIVPSKEAAETLAQTLHTETGAGVSKNPRARRNPKVTKGDLGIIKDRLKDVDKKLDTARHETFDAQSTLSTVRGNLEHIAQQPE